MNDDRILEFMAQVSDYMRSTDRRFEQLITVMHNGFERVNTQISQLTNEVRATNQRVDVLTNEVREVKTEVREIKTELQATNRRLNATFDQAGRLTEENTGQQTRLRQLETEEPTNAELHQRVLALEEQMRRAS